MTEVIVQAAPVLGHVEGVQLMQTGTWPADTGGQGPLVVTVKKIAAAIEALDCTAVRRPILKLGHTGEIGSIGDPACGWVDNLRTDNEGQTLVGDFRGMPGWLTEQDDDGVSILAAAYPDRSIEGWHDWTCTKGHTHPFVVAAVSLLGVEQPAIGTLESLVDLYGVAASAPGGDGAQPVRLTTHGGDMPKQVRASATTDDVRRAFYDGPGQNWELWIREMYIDPAELIVNNDESGVINRLSYSIDSKGAVTFGELEPVKIQYVAARASAGDRAEAWAAKAESRAGMPTAASAPNTPAAPASGDPQSRKESAVAFDDTQLDTLRKLAGVPADADEATILAALDEAVGEAAPTPQPTPTPAPAPAVTEPPQPIAAGRVPDGAIVVDAEAFAQLQQQGRAGMAAAQRFAQQDRDSAINDAVKAGKLPPARAGHWQTLWDNDPEGTKAALASMPNNLVPTEHVGSFGDPAGPDLDAEFAGMFSPDFFGKAV